MTDDVYAKGANYAIARWQIVEINLLTNVKECDIIWTYKEKGEQ